MRDMLNMQAVNFEAKYLGLPTPDGPICAEQFSTIVRSKEMSSGWW
jgi:hypothetical protein